MIYNFILHFFGFCFCSHSHFDLLDLFVSFSATYAPVSYLMKKIKFKQEQN